MRAAFSTTGLTASHSRGRQVPPRGPPTGRPRTRPPAGNSLAEKCSRDLSTGGEDGLAILNLEELNSCLFIFSRSICWGIDAGWLASQWSHRAQGWHVPQPPKAAAFTWTPQDLKRVLPSPRGTCSFSEELAAAAKLLQLWPTSHDSRQQLTRLFCPWDSPGKNTGVGCHFPLQCMHAC